MRQVICYSARPVDVTVIDELTAARPAPDVTLGRWVWQQLIYPPYLCLFGLGVAARVVLMALYSPAVMLWVDGPRFARVGGISFFGDFWMPAGYPAFLHVLRAVTTELSFTIGVQHFLGLCTGVCLFLAGRWLGLPRWAACLPAAVAFLSGDHLYLERW